MGARTRWQRLDAELWVHVWGMVGTTLLGLATAVVLFHAWLAGVLLVTALPAGLTAFAGWLTSAWRRELPWVWTSGTAFVSVLALGALASGRPAAVVPLLASGLLLLLLCHPDCRARIEAAPAVPR